MTGELWVIKNPEITPGVLEKLLTILVWRLIFKLNPIQHMNGHPD